MTHVIPATFDGTTFHPEQPVAIPPNTRVLLTVEAVACEPRLVKPTSFVDTALSLRIDGPSDWSSRVDHYLYGNLADADE
jgi:hypothetical protein